MEKIAAVYARVSTRHQEEEATIASQVAAIESYARSQGYQLGPELYYLDEAVSGAKLDRPALDRLRDQASAGCFEVVVCLSPDRLARQYALQLLLFEEFSQEGIEVVFVNQPPVRDDPQSQLFLGIQGLFAEYERAMIGERMRRGRLHTVRQGRMVQPVTPYGYRYGPKEGSTGGHWVIEEAEAEVVRQIYAWYTQANGLTAQAIAERLGESRAPTRCGGRWHRSQVTRILRQDQYTGVAYYNRTQKAYNEVGQLRTVGHGKRWHPVRTPRLAEEWIAVPAPAILDPDTWQAAQERMKTNRQYASRHNQRHFYLLRGLLLCGVCGHTLTGRAWDKRKSYGCTHGGKYCPPDLPRHACIITAEVAEALVWQAIRQLLQDPQRIAQAWNNLAETAATGATQSDRQRLEHRLTTVRRQQERLLDLYQEEQLEKSIYLERQQRLRQEQEALQNQVQRLLQQDRSELAKQQWIDTFAQFCQRIQANLENPTSELQREVIRLLVDHIVVHENEIVIKHIIPSDDVCRLSPKRQAAKRAKILS